MKKYLIAFAMILALGMGGESAAQTHRHHPRTAVVADSTEKDALEAYSDTTDTVMYQGAAQQTGMDDDDDAGGFYRFWGMSDHIPDAIVAIVAILSIFVLSPVIIIALVFYFIYKNRKQKMKLAEMAMRSGQPIPDQLLKGAPPVDDGTWNSGIRQSFVGIGLIIFFWFIEMDAGIGVGFLVLFMGLGKLVIARTSRKHNINNEQIKNDYEQ